MLLVIPFVLETTWKATIPLPSSAFLPLKSPPEGHHTSSLPSYSLLCRCQRIAGLVLLLSVRRLVLESIKTATILRSLSAFLPLETPPEGPHTSSLASCSLLCRCRRIAGIALLLPVIPRGLESAWKASILPSVHPFSRLEIGRQGEPQTRRVK